MPARKPKQDDLYTPPRARKAADYEGRHQAGPGRATPRVKPDAPGKAGTKGPTATRRRAPQHDAGTAKPLTGAAKTARSRRRAQDVGEGARDYAILDSMNRGGGGPPSVTGHALTGGAVGAAAGSAIAPGPGTVVGGAVGGVGGALAGRKAKKAFKMARSASPGMRKIIVMEFTICMVIAAFSPLTDRRTDEPRSTMMKRLTAIMVAFFVLGLISATGRGPSKFAAGFGGLITVVLASSNRDLFLKLATLFGAKDYPEPAEGGIAAAAAGGALGGAEVGSDAYRIAGRRYTS